LFNSIFAFVCAAEMAVIASVIAADCAIGFQEHYFCLKLYNNV